MKLINSLWGIVALAVLTTIAVSQLSGPTLTFNPTHGPLPPPSPTPELKDTRDLSKYGSVAIDGPEIQDRSEYASRFRISQRYDNQDWVFPRVESWTGGVGRVDENPAPALMPSDESQLIVTGSITDVHTFLSTDKRGVYTEFKIKLDEILKNEESAKIGGTVTADREGGVVIYPGGQRVLYQSSKRELLKPRTAYLLFLSKDNVSPNYRIVASYELVGTDDLRPLETGRGIDNKTLKKKVFFDTLRNKMLGQ